MDQELNKERELVKKLTDADFRIRFLESEINVLRKNEEDLKRSNLVLRTKMELYENTLGKVIDMVLDKL